MCYIHATIVPNLKATNELKTKPTQHSVDMLRSRGIQPDIIVCRTERTLSAAIREKLSLFTDVDINAVIQCKDVQHLYEVPLFLRTRRTCCTRIGTFTFTQPVPDLTEWKEYG